MSNQSLRRPRGAYRYQEGQRGLYWFWWLLGVCAQVVILLPGVIKSLHFRAMLTTSCLFVVLIFVLENLGIYLGWWIWNERKILGPKVLLLPLEEFLLYFVVVPSVLIILVYCFKITRYFDQRRK